MKYSIGNDFYDLSESANEKDLVLGMAMYGKHILTSKYDVETDASGSAIVYTEIKITDMEQDPPAPAVRIMVPNMKLIHRHEGQFTYRPLDPEICNDICVKAIDAAIAEYEAGDGSAVVKRLRPEISERNLITAPVDSCLPADFDLSVFLPIMAKENPVDDINSIEFDDRLKRVALLIRGLMKHFDADMLSVGNMVFRMFSNMIGSGNPLDDGMEYLEQHEGIIHIESWSKKASKAYNAGCNNSLVHQDFLGQSYNIRNVYVPDEMLREQGILDAEGTFRLEIDGRMETFRHRVRNSGSIGQFFRKLIDFYTFRKWPERGPNEIGEHGIFIIMDSDTFKYIDTAISFETEEDWDNLVGDLQRYDLLANTADACHMVRNHDGNFGIFEKGFSNSLNNHIITLDEKQLKVDGFIQDEKFCYVADSGLLYPLG